MQQISRRRAHMHTKASYPPTTAQNPFTTYTHTTHTHTLVCTSNPARYGTMCALCTYIKGGVFIIIIIIIIIIAVDICEGQLPQLCDAG